MVTGQFEQPVPRLGPPVRKSISLLTLLLAGLWFAQLQVSSLFLLQTYYTASFQAYLILVTAWLGGALVGVWLRLPTPSLLWFTSFLTSAGLVQIWTAQWNLPIELSWSLLFISALPAGFLFRHHRRYWDNSGSMFFAEATGFTIGLPVATILLMKNGVLFCHAVPYLGLLLLLISLKWGRKA